MKRLHKFFSAEIWDEFYCIFCSQWKGSTVYICKNEAKNDYLHLEMQSTSRESKLVVGNNMKFAWASSTDQLKCEI